MFFLRPKTNPSANLVSSSFKTYAESDYSSPSPPPPTCFCSLTPKVDSLHCISWASCCSQRDSSIPDSDLQDPRWSGPCFFSAPFVDLAWALLPILFIPELAQHPPTSGLCTRSPTPPLEGALSICWQVISLTSLCANRDAFSDQPMSTNTPSLALSFPSTPFIIPPKQLSMFDILYKCLFYFFICMYHWFLH